MSLWKNAEAGQAQLELVIGAGLLVGTLTLSGWVIRAEWHRAQCAILVFERAHARLTLGDEDARAEGRCGRAEERVNFKSLERYAEER